MVSKRFLIFTGIVSVILVIDQLTKTLIRKYSTDFAVLKNFFSMAVAGLRHVAPVPQLEMSHVVPR